MQITITSRSNLLNFQVKSECGDLLVDYSEILVMETRNPGEETSRTWKVFQWPGLPSFQNEVEKVLGVYINQETFNEVWWHVTRSTMFALEKHTCT